MRETAQAFLGDAGIKMHIVGVGKRRGMKRAGKADPDQPWPRPWRDGNGAIVETLAGAQACAIGIDPHTGKEPGVACQCGCLCGYRQPHDIPNQWRTGLPLLHDKRRIAGDNDGQREFDAAGMLGAPCRHEIGLAAPWQKDRHTQPPLGHRHRRECIRNALLGAAPVRR